MSRIYYVLVTTVKRGTIINKYDNTDLDILKDDFNFLYGLNDTDLTELLMGKNVVNNGLNFYCTFIEF